MRQAFLPSSSGGRSVGKYGVVLRATSSATSPKRGATAAMYVTSSNRTLFLVSQRSILDVTSVEDPLSETSANRITAPVPYRDEAPT